MTVIVFEVYGTPAPQGSKRHVGGGRMVESSKLVPAWREAVKQAALTALADRDIAYGENGDAVRVDVIFFMARPKSHYRTGANSHLLRGNAPNWPAGKPDLDKLVRSTLDALTDAGVWRDDSQVVVIHAEKSYSALRAPGACVYVNEAAP